MPNIAGTRDSFGISKAFVDERTNKTIDNWRSWERAGYRDPMNVVKNHKIKEGIKDKMKRVLKKGRPKQLAPETLR